MNLKGQCREDTSGKGMTGVVFEKMKKATTSSFGQGNYRKKVSKECVQKLIFSKKQTHSSLTAISSKHETLIKSRRHCQLYVWEISCLLAFVC